MGVEYRRYLIPRPNTFRPGADAALALIAALRKEGWILSEDAPALKRLAFEQSTLYRPAKGHGYFARTTGETESFGGPIAELLRKYASRDLMIVWPVESLGSSGLRYPLEPAPFSGATDMAESYYEIQLHFARDFIYHTSETIDPFEPAPACPRGHTVEIDTATDEDPFYALRLAANCPTCGSAFDPSRLIAAGRDGWTGDSVQLQGGAAYRFALVVDCGKSFGERRLHIHHQLKTLAEQTLGKAMYEVEEFY